MHAPYILSADDLDDFFGICRKPSILAADDFLGACYRKAVTPKSYGLYFSPKESISVHDVWEPLKKSGSRKRGVEFKGGSRHD